MAFIEVHLADLQSIPYFRSQNAVSIVFFDRYVSNVFDADNDLLVKSTIPRVCRSWSVQHDLLPLAWMRNLKENDKKDVYLRISWISDSSSLANGLSPRRFWVPPYDLRHVLHVFDNIRALPTLVFWSEMHNECAETIVDLKKRDVFVQSFRIFLCFWTKVSSETFNCKRVTNPRCVLIVPDAQCFFCFMFICHE